MSFVYSLPKKLDAALRWFDLRHNRIDNTTLHRNNFLEGYSPLALWLPIPVLVALAYGALRWRGWPLAVLCAAAIVAHVLACRWLKGRRLPQFLWVLFLLLVLVVWWLAGTKGLTLSSVPYRHLFGPFAVFVLALGMPACRWWADWLITRDEKKVDERDDKRRTFREVFAPQLEHTELYVTSPPQPDRPLRIVRAFFLVLLKSPLSLVLFPAFAMLVARPGALMLVFVSVLLVTWVLLAAAHYDDRLQTFQILLRQVFLFGWPGVVSFVVIVLAAARIAGVSYVTTVLDQASWTIIFGLVLLLYLIFWLYDYWRQRALAEVLLGLLHEGEDHPHRIAYTKKNEPDEPGHLQIHGAGRLIAIKEVRKPGRPKWQFESYQPLEVFRKLHEQLEGRARSKKASWEEVNEVAERLDALEEKVPLSQRCRRQCWPWFSWSVSRMCSRSTRRRR